MKSVYLGSLRTKGLLLFAAFLLLFGLRAPWLVSLPFCGRDESWFFQELVLLHGKCRTVQPCIRGRMWLFGYCWNGWIRSAPSPVYITCLPLLVPLCALPSGLEGRVELFGDVLNVLAVSARAEAEVSGGGQRKALDSCVETVTV